MREQKEKYSYSGLHLLLNRKHPRSGACYFCKSVRRTQWALKKGKEYTTDIGNYFELCTPCHKKYDYTEQAREKISASKLGKPATWRRKQFHCDIDGCKNKHCAIGLCRSHYNKKYWVEVESKKLT